MMENDFYIAIQNILDQAKESGFSIERILDMTEEAALEWEEETEK